MNWLHRRYGLRMSQNNWALVQRLCDGATIAAVILILVVIYGIMSMHDAEASEAHQTYLVVVYRPHVGSEYLEVSGLDIRVHKVDKAECNAQAKQIYANVKAGKVRAFCM